jgi:enolase
VFASESVGLSPIVHDERSRAGVEWPSAPAGGTEDSTIADLAVATNCGQNL